MSTLAFTFTFTFALGLVAGLAAGFAWGLYKHQLGFNQGFAQACEDHTERQP